MAVTDERVSRRKLLKRAGVGAAVLGAGSMATALGASAAAPPSKACIDAGGCGEAQPGCGACCGCVITTEGCCFCHQFIFCAGAPPCTASSQCPPGWACAVLTGCGAAGICVPHCGAVNAHVAPCGAGAQTAGRTSAPAA